MILVDANLLLYAYNPSSERHAAAKRWWEDRLSSPEPVLLPWSTIGAFLRLATNARIFPNPYSPTEAAAIVTAWLTRPMVVIPEPSLRYWPLLRGLIEEANARGNLATDAMLAALALDQGSTLVSTDRDFRRFPRLRLLDPFASEA